MRSASWLVLGASAAVVLAALALLPPEWIARAETGVAAWRGWLGAARIGAIVAAWVWWDALVARVPAMTPDAVAWLRERRVFWVGALVAIELVVVRNVLAALKGLVA